MQCSGHERQTFTWRSGVGRASVFALFTSSCIALLSTVHTSARQAQPGPAPVMGSPRAVLEKYCITCHNEKLRTAGIAHVGSVQIGGPYGIAGPAKSLRPAARDRKRLGVSSENDTPSRRAIFVCHPNVAAEEGVCATRILT